MGKKGHRDKDNKEEERGRGEKAKIKVCLHVLVMELWQVGPGGKKEGPRLGNMAAGKKRGGHGL